MSQLIYYMDETGNRNPDKKPDASREGRDWFGLGGFIIDQSDEAEAKRLHQELTARWGIQRPLHLTDMMAAKKDFGWLGRLSERDRSAFWEDYKGFLASLPVIGSGCIISRPGYVARGYLEKHAGSKWLLCRSAFDITIERAVKYANYKGKKLSVVFESDIAVNELVKSYFKNLKENGLEFNADNSGKYQPLSKEHFSETLGTIEYKDKKSVLLQIADSYIYAIARQKYERLFPMYCRLRDEQKIMDFSLGGDAGLIKAMGVKYYCFDK